MGKKKMKLATWLVSRKLMTVDQAEQVIVEQGLNRLLKP